MSTNPNIDNNEIDLKELSAAIWAHKFVIFVSLALGIGCAFYYSLKAQKEYTAEAIFQIKQENDGAINIPGELNSLALIAGLNTSQNSNLGMLVARAKTREFILEIEKSLLLSEDKFFNKYDRNNNVSFWVYDIYEKLFSTPKLVNVEQIIEGIIIESYEEYVDIQITEDGAISISVTHNSPDKSAIYSNTIMEKIKLLVETEEIETANVRLKYLSETLADALQEMEFTQQKLKNFALRSSTGAQQNFLRGSFLLEKLRDEQDEAVKFRELLLVIRDLIENEDRLDQKAYEKLRINYPLIDDVRFRRVVGMSETISAWNWPKLDTLDAVSNTLADRILRLKVEITDLEGEAKRDASSAEELEQLQREAKIAEATYTVLIEQVKSQTLAAGFRPNSFKVFQYAVAPIEHSSPNTPILLLSGAIIGLIFGCVIALINSIRKGVYFTVSSLISDSRAALNFSSRKLKRLSRLSLLEINKQLQNRSFTELDETLLAVASSNVVLVCNLGARFRASGLSKILAIGSAKTGRKVLLINSDPSAFKREKIKRGENLSGFNIYSTEVDLDIFSWENVTNLNQLSLSPQFHEKLEEIITKYDQVFISISEEFNGGLLKSFKKFNPILIVITRMQKTEKKDIKQTKSVIPIEVIFYE